MGVKKMNNSFGQNSMGICCEGSQGQTSWATGLYNNSNNNNKQEFMYRDTTNVEPEMYDYTNNNWSHWNSNEKLKEKFGSCTGKTLDRFTTKDSYTWNITHNTESTAV